MTDTIYPILDFDPALEAIIEPSKVIKPIDIPQRCVLCFFQDVINTVCRDGGRRVIAHVNTEMGNNPIYDLELDGEHIAVMHPGVGAPLAAGFTEELIALGCRKFIACGGAGVLNSELAVGHVVVPTSAIRDEGTSYHYLPPEQEALPSARGVVAIQSVLDKHQIPYVLGKTWTTDAFYRETRSRMEKRKAAGCLTVEMEASAFFAVAEFRGIDFAQILYGGDDLGGEVWDHRDWISRTSTREKLLWLSAEAVLAL